MSPSIVQAREHHILGTNERGTVPGLYLPAQGMQLGTLVGRLQHRCNYEQSHGGPEDLCRPLQV